VWDVSTDERNAVGDPPSDFLMIYPYVRRNDDTKSLVSYETKPSHYPLVRFECEFIKQETPTHVEVIPAANANRDGVEWSNERQRLNSFPSLNISSASNPIGNHTPDNFYNQSQGNGRAPIMPRHVLLEGKLRADDRWEMLDVIELPFSYHELPYPLYKLIYQRKIKYIRFTIMSIYMSMQSYPSLFYSYLYFPKMDFFTKPEN